MLDFGQHLGRDSGRYLLGMEVTAQPSFTLRNENRGLRSSRLTVPSEKYRRQ